MNNNSFLSKGIRRSPTFTELSVVQGGQRRPAASDTSCATIGLGGFSWQLWAGSWIVKHDTPQVVAVKPGGKVWLPLGLPRYLSRKPHLRGAGGFSHFTATCGRGLPQQHRGRGTGFERGTEAGVAPKAVMDGGSPPTLLASAAEGGERRRRGGRRSPVPTAVAQGRLRRASPRRAGGRMGSGDPPQALSAEALPLPGPSPEGTPYLRGLVLYGTAPTLPGDASAIAPPCCTAKGLRARPGPLRGGRAAPERRAATPGR